MLSDALKSEIKGFTARYPQPKAAVMMGLHRVREEYGRIPKECYPDVAEAIGITPLEVEEVVTFYPLFEIRPKGKHVVHVCTTLSCALGGCQDLLAHVKEKHGVALGGHSADGTFSLYGAQCIGACHEAPAILVDLERHPNVTPEKFDEIVGGLRA